LFGGLQPGARFVQRLLLAFVVLGLLLRLFGGTPGSLFLLGGGDQRLVLRGARVPLQLFPGGFFVALRLFLRGLLVALGLLARRLLVPLLLGGGQLGGLPAHALRAAAR